MTVFNLTLGGFDLVDPTGAARGVAVVAAGTSRGNPVPIDVTVQTWMRDGSLTYRQGYDDRTCTVRIRISGMNLLACDKAAEALFAEIGKPNLLTWTPSSTLAFPSVFEVINSTMDEDDGDDLSDIYQLEPNPFRLYAITMVCKPFVRSLTKTTIPAIAYPTSTTTSNIDDCNSTSGWTGLITDTGGGTTYGQSFTAVSDATGTALKLTSAATPAGQSVDFGFRRSVSLAFTATTRYITVDHFYGTDYAYTGYGSAVSLYLQSGAQSVLCDTVALQTSPLAGYFRATFRVPDAITSASALNFIVTTEADRPSIRSIQVTAFALTNQPPAASTTGRQKIRSLAVPGSARTTGDLHLSSATTGLGSVLLYTCPEDGSGYLPALSTARTSGPGRTPDSTTRSGARNDFASSFTTFIQPAIQVPSGRHDLMVAMRSSVAGSHTVAFSAYAQMGSTLYGAQSGSATVTLVANAWTFVRVGSAALPPAALPGSLGKIRIDLRCTNSPSGATVELDEAWLFCINDADGHPFGSLTSTYCDLGTPATGGPSSHLWLNSADIDTPRPQLLVGSIADASDAHGGAPTAAFEEPIFNPGALKVFYVTDAPDALVDGSFFARWAYNAAA